LPFKCNLQRYTEEQLAKLAREDEITAMKAATVGA
jgi:hypothetical protein